MNNLSKVDFIEQDGFFDFRHVNFRTWDETCEQFAINHGMLLPSWSCLETIGNTRDLRLLLSPITITITFKSSMWWQYRFERGYITDLASVPSFFRSKVDNDDIDLLAAALVHDCNFAIHHHSFEKTNELFYKMIMMREGVPGADDHWAKLSWRAKWAYWAVNSFVGKRYWNKTNANKSEWARRTTSFLRDR